MTNSYRQHAELPDFPIVAPSGETPQSADNYLDFFTLEQAQGVLSRFIENLPADMKSRVDQVFLNSPIPAMLKAPHVQSQAELRHTVAVMMVELNATQPHGFIPCAYLQIHHNPYQIDDARFFATMLTGYFTKHLEDWALCVALEEIVLPCMEEEGDL